MDENTNHSVYIGIDPGASGGLAALWFEMGEKWGVFTQKLGCTDKEAWEWFKEHSKHHGRQDIPFRLFAVIEKVGGYVGSAQPGSAMFKFGRSYGFLHGCLVAAGIQYVEATPQKWQKFLGIAPRRKEESKTQWKNRLRMFAERLYPNVKVTLAVADALLIATYCQRIHEGKPCL